VATRSLRRPPWLAPRATLSLRSWESLGSGLFNFLVVAMLGIYLFPMLYMVSTAFMESRQLQDRYAPPYPARQLHFTYAGRDLLVYNVPVEGRNRPLALVEAGRQSSKFVDPQNPEAGLIEWKGSWRLLPGVYRFHLSWSNFAQLFDSLRLTLLVKNTLLMALISEIGVLISSILVAYGFARFRLPGGDLLFYVMIATLLIPEKVTLIPTYFVFVRVLDWNGSWLPILLPFFFGNAVYIFLLRQSFKSMPVDLEEAATLDGAGPLRTLVSVVLPQFWPVLITVSLLHFFYIWNETRLAALYLSTRRDLIPISFGIQNFQSLAPIQNLLQASALIIMIVPVIVILLSQRFFMQNLIITGTEK
jgi:multiple sugar transport system permease protein